MKRRLNLLASGTDALQNSVSSVNRADGISEIEGKAAMGSGERVGKGASFKSVVACFHLRESFQAKNTPFFTRIHRTP